MQSYLNEKVTVFHSSLYQTTSTVIETDTALFVVDPNWLPSEVERLKSYVNKRRKGKKLFLILTHSDFDHILGANAFDSAVVISTQEFQNHPNKQGIVQEIKDFDRSYYLERSYSISYPEVDIVVEENGQKLEEGDITLTFFKAPGHTYDGLITVIEPLGIMIAGDYLSDVEFPFVFDSFSSYKKTLQTFEQIVSQYNVKLLVPGHGNPASGLSSIQHRIEASKKYIQGLLNNEDLVEWLKQEYSFFEGMKEVHQQNIEKAKNEGFC
ncbi:MBL fold metallo-hydrolase [Pontibacillus yanchengensis]|uniref:Hydrolase glyoxylase n=1 Tax=Pontibacillus yanchengensis Y32 TaxID=1385514 RepID=A0A0A2TCQ0_9BACI|nr:MBL fold metallo-hydrolase [Pontibacillus yanchengensis]KGP72203.1 hydrolase glyoxylase [Pontibacillus yanchengensis Y32]